jgi:hypothetical protein
VLRQQLHIAAYWLLLLLQLQTLHAEFPQS